MSFSLPPVSSVKSGWEMISSTMNTCSFSSVTFSMDFPRKTLYTGVLGFLFDLSESKKIHEGYWFLTEVNNLNRVPVLFHVFFSADKKKQSWLSCESWSSTLKGLLIHYLEWISQMSRHCKMHVWLTATNARHQQSDSPAEHKEDQLSTGKETP